jgi:hypothetical protein
MGDFADSTISPATYGFSEAKRNLLNGKEAEAG